MGCLARNGFRVSASSSVTARNSTPWSWTHSQADCERGIERFAAPSWQQTTAALVRASDVLVFMEREHYDVCKDWLDPVRQTVEIWEIPEVGPVDAARIMTEVEQTFEMIEQRADTLLTTLGFL
jgi:hypothetical protein